MGSSWAIIKGILIGIIPHKVIVLSSLGAQYIHSRLPFPFAATLAFVFAMVMPSGTLSGHLFIHSLEDEKKSNYLPDNGCSLDLEDSESTTNA